MEEKLKPNYKRTMLFVRHGDSRPDAKQTALDALAGDD